MTFISMRLMGFLLVTQLFALSAFAQRDSIMHQVEIKHDNDFTLFTDRYYSSGLFLTYRKRLKNGISKNNTEQLSFTLRQQVYTPSQTRSTNSALFDMPYAGFSGLTTKWSLATETEFFETSILLGVAGLNSGAGGFQRWFHNIISISESPLWIDEISTSFHVNNYTSYAKEWQLAFSPFGVYFAAKPNIALGTKDIYIEPEAVFYFGSRNTIDKSSAYHSIGSLDSETYFTLRGSLRRVFYNGLLEGNLLGDNSPFVITPSRNLFRLGLDFQHRFKRNSYKVGLRYNSPETALAKAHQYLILSYGLSF